MRIENPRTTTWRKLALLPLLPLLLCFPSLGRADERLAASGESNAPPAGRETQNASASAASSDQEAPVSLGQARRAFLAGRQLMREEQWEGAAEQFAIAARGKNTPAIRYYLGYCFEHDARPIEARREYEQAMTLLESQAAADVKQLLPDAMARIDGMIGQLVIRGLPKNALLEIDGNVVAPETFEIDVNPGEHELRGRAPGYKDHKLTVLVAAGQAQIVEMPLTEEELPVDTRFTTTATPKSKTSLRPVTFWGSTGLAVAGGATGIAGVAVNASAKSDAQNLRDSIDEISGGATDACSSGTGPEQECSDLQAAMERQDVAAGLMIGGFSAMAVGVTGALLTHFLWPKAEVNVAGAVHSHGGHLLVTKRF